MKGHYRWLDVFYITMQIDNFLENPVCYKKQLRKYQVFVRKPRIYYTVLQYLING